MLSVLMLGLLTPPAVCQVIYCSFPFQSFVFSLFCSFSFLYSILLCLHTHLPCHLLRSFFALQESYLFLPLDEICVSFLNTALPTTHLFFDADP